MKDELLVPVLLDEGASAPEYRSAQAAGADLRANLVEPLRLEPLERAAVPTGIRLELPEGWEGQVRPRSGLALSRGLGCINSPGTIDSDYRGEIKVILVNLSNQAAVIQPGERIAQLVLSPVGRGRFEARDSLLETARGEGGFGSTGS